MWVVTPYTFFPQSKFLETCVSSHVISIPERGPSSKVY